MSEWSRRAEVSIRYAQDDPRPPETREVSEAELPQLRQEVMADCGVESTRIRWTTRLVGQSPERCPHGHPWHDGARPAAVRMRWLLCRSCGGHQWLECSTCGAVQLDPQPTPECGPAGH